MVQLAGREAEWMAEAARVVEANGAISSISMGCPAKKVIGGYSGSALMRDPDHALSLIEATVKAVKIPVTVKMRLGWDDTSLNAPLIARRAQEAGVAMVTVHGRTRMQFYTGRADWDAIRAVRDVLTIPLVANGDVDTRADADEILRRSGADAVMIGRAAQGRPWHLGVVAGVASEPDAGSVAEIFAAHYRGMMEFYGEKGGVRHARKHVGWYLDRHAPNLPPVDKGAIMTSDAPSEVLSRVVEAMATPAATGHGRLPHEHETPVARRHQGRTCLAVGGAERHPEPRHHGQRDRHVVFANWEAESFSAPVPIILARHDIRAFIPFGSPLLTLIDQVRERLAPVNEYRVDLSSPRLGADKLVDLYVAPVRGRRAAWSSSSRNAPWPTRSIDS